MRFFLFLTFIVIVAGQECVHQWVHVTDTELKCFKEWHTSELSMSAKCTAKVIESLGCDFHALKCPDNAFTYWFTEDARNEFANLFKDWDGNPDVSDWNVEKGVMFDSMFENAKGFNRPLDRWNMSSALSLKSMLKGATAYNHLVDFNLPNVQFLDSMLEGATSFNSRVTLQVNVHPGSLSAASMLKDCTQFDDNILITPLASIKSLNKFLFGASSFNRPLRWISLPATVDIADAFTGTSALYYSMDCWANGAIDWEMQWMGPNCKPGNNKCTLCKLPETLTILDKISWGTIVPSVIGVAVAVVAIVFHGKME